MGFCFVVKIDPSPAARKPRTPRSITSPSVKDNGEYSLEYSLCVEWSIGEKTSANSKETKKQVKREFSIKTATYREYQNQIG